MATTFFPTLQSMLVLLTFILTGLFLGKKRIVPDDAYRTLSKVCTTLFTPALSLSALLTSCTRESLKEQFWAIAAGTVVLAAAVILGFALARLFAKDGYMKQVYRYAMVVANHGFVGAALIPMLFGQEALYTYMLFTLPLNVFTSTFGFMALIPSKDGKSPLKRAFLNPIFIAIIIGLVSGVTGLTPYLPKFVTDSVSKLASCMAPVGMLLTGLVISRYRFRDLLANKKVYLATLLRLFVIPAVLLSLLRLINKDPTVMICGMFAYAAPLGLNLIIFPSSCGEETSDGASMVMVSHFLCVLSIPLMYSLVSLLGWA